jgi:hypothetical protein
MYYSCKLGAGCRQNHKKRRADTDNQQGLKTKFMLFVGKWLSLPKESFSRFFKGSPRPDPTGLTLDCLTSVGSPSHVK